MPVLRQWNGSAWVDVQVSIGNTVTTDGAQTITAVKTFTAIPVVPDASFVATTKLTATGTKDATTFLRGDNTFVAAGLPTGGTVNQALIKTGTPDYQAAWTDLYATKTFTTPAAASVSTQLLIPLTTLAAFSQVLAFGVNAASPVSARAMAIFDARTVAHQPTLFLFNPGENDGIGFNWNGSNADALVGTLGGTISLAPNSRTAATAPLTVADGAAGVSTQMRGVAGLIGRLGADVPFRFVGGTVSGIPTQGTWAVGDVVHSQTGHVYTCTVAGTPGTWVATPAPTNMVTTDTTQTITGAKSFAGITTAITQSAVATAVAPAQPSNYFAFTTSAWSGTAAVQEAVYLRGVRRTGAAFDFALQSEAALRVAPYDNTNVQVATLVGGTASGPPTAGTYQQKDFLVTATGKVFVCTVGGTPGTWVDAGAPGATTVASVTAAHTAVAGSVVLANGTFTVTLPAPTSGAQVTIKNIGTGVITIAGTVDGTTTTLLSTQYQSLTVVSDGTAYYNI